MGSIPNAVCLFPTRIAKIRIRQQCDPRFVAHRAGFGGRLTGNVGKFLGGWQFMHGGISDKYGAVSGDDH